MKLLCTRGAQFEYGHPITKKPYFSTSQLLAKIDPNLYAYVGEAVMESARQRGVDLHLIFFYWLASIKGLCAVPARPPAYAGFYDAIGKFIADHRPEPILLEESSIDDKWGVAGTPDAKLWIAKKVDMPDLKTGIKQRIHEAQLNCYRRLEEYRDVQTMHQLYIHADGTYDYLPVYREPMHEAALENAVVALQCEVNLQRWRTLT
jgi:hypothetical protein